MTRLWQGWPNPGMAKKRAGKKGTSKRKVKRTPKAPAVRRSVGTPSKTYWIRNCNGLRFREWTGPEADLAGVLAGYDKRDPRMAPHRV